MNNSNPAPSSGKHMMTMGQLQTQAHHWHQAIETDSPAAGLQWPDKEGSGWSAVG